MKKIITALAALSAIGLAAPAAAQDRYGNQNGYGYNNGHGGGMEARIGHLRHRLQFGIQRGSISRHEAVYLRHGIRQVTRLERQYGRDGLSRNERRFLQDRLHQLQQQIHAAERNRDGRDGDRDGRDWRDGRDDRNDGDRRWDDDNRRDGDRYDD